jgi:hypothetical protein
VKSLTGQTGNLHGAASHTMTATELINEKFSFIIECTCGWTGRSHSITDADGLMDGHVRNQHYLVHSSGIRAGGL